jgi:hypothetical protein
MMTGVDELGNRNGMKQRRKVSSEMGMVHVLTITFYCALALSIVWALSIAFR